MVDKKEKWGYIAAVVALMGCCLLLTTILTGGGLAIIGVHLKQKWVIILGIVILIAGLSSVFIRRKRRR